MTHVRDPQQLKARMRDHIMQDNAFAIDYIAMVDPANLEDRPCISGLTPSDPREYDRPP